MDDYDFGYFGKGTSGYMHYMLSTQNGGGGGGGGGSGCGCLLLIAVVYVVFWLIGKLGR